MKNDEASKEGEKDAKKEGEADKNGKEPAKANSKVKNSIKRRWGLKNVT